jgi:hypothetical protein
MLFSMSSLRSRVLIAFSCSQVAMLKSFLLEGRDSFFSVLVESYSDFSGGVHVEVTVLREDAAQTGQR